jgi:hypothetical protein
MEEGTVIPDKDGTDVRTAEREEASARVKLDFAALDSFWSDDLLIHGTELLIFTKSQFMSRLKSGSLRYRSFERTISKLVERDNLVITFGSEAIVPETGQQAGQRLLCSYTHVWVKNGSGWRLAGRHVATITTIPEEIL